MCDLIDDIPLLHVPTGAFHNASLFQGVGERHILSIEQHWVPILDERLAQIQRNHGINDGQITPIVLGELKALNMQDVRWDWRRKNFAIQRNFGYEGFVIEHGEKTQGVMYLNLADESRMAHKSNLGMIGLEFLATAPWNRPSLMKQQYRGIGESMLLVAIQSSMDEGFNGRIGLHSLPQAEGFYRNYNMTDLGVDSTGMRYFEMTPEQAADFIRRVTGDE